MAAGLCGLALLGLIVGWARPLCAADAPSVPDPMRRFLFIVDTSFSMDRLRPALYQALGEFIAAGLEGWLRPGDTYGLWTFNEQVHTDFPVQVWDPAQRATLAQRAVEHLRRQRFEKQGRLSRVITDFQAVVAGVTNVTALILTDGEASVKGTPFDAVINSALKEVASEMRKRRQPIVIALIAQGGRIAKWGVNSPEMRLPLPKPPVPAPPAPAFAQTPAVAEPAPASASALTPSPPVLRPATPPALAPASNAETNRPAMVPADPAPTPTLAEKTTSVKTNAAAPPRKRTVARRAQTAPIILTREPAPPKPAAPTATNEPPARAGQESAPSSQTNAPPSVAPPSVALVTTNALVQTPQTSAPAPQPLVLTSAVSTSTRPESPARTAPEPIIPAELPGASPVGTPPSARDPATSPARPVQRDFLLAGLALVGLAVLVGLWFSRRRRAVPQPSLITRGMSRMR